MSTKERRSYPRCLVCTTANLEPKPAESSPGFKGMVRDLSLSGASILTRASFAQGQAAYITINMYDGSEKSIETMATVVRSERIDPDCADVWTQRVAVEFEEPLEGDEEDRLAWLSDRARRARLSF